MHTAPATSTVSPRQTPPSEADGAGPVERTESRAPVAEPLAIARGATGLADRRRSAWQHMPTHPASSGFSVPGASGAGLSRVQSHPAPRCRQTGRCHQVHRTRPRLHTPVVAGSAMKRDQCQPPRLRAHGGPAASHRDRHRSQQSGDSGDPAAQANARAAGHRYPPGQNRSRPDQAATIRCCSTRFHRNGGDLPHREPQAAAERRTAHTHATRRCPTRHVSSSGTPDNLFEPCEQV